MVLDMREAPQEEDCKLETIGEIVQETEEEIQENADDVMLPEEIAEELIEELDEEEAAEETCEMEELEPDYAVEVTDIIVKDDTTEVLTTDDAEDLKSSPSKSLHSCTSCPKKFKKLSLLTRHQKTHSSEKKSHECTKCGKKLPSEVAMVRHDVLHSDIVTRSKIARSENQKFVCVICNNQFRNPETLSSHHKTHKASLENSREIQCRLCEETFETFTDIVRHSKSHIENATHQCVICKKLFILNDEAIDHFLRHKGQKPHKCPVCQKSFLKLHKLNVHVKIHEDEKVRLSQSSTISHSLT